MQVTKYDMTTGDAGSSTSTFADELRPLYLATPHLGRSYELAARYWQPRAGADPGATGSCRHRWAPVVEMLPAPTDPSTFLTGKPARVDHAESRRCSYTGIGFVRQRSPRSGSDPTLPSSRGRQAQEHARIMLAHGPRHGHSRPHEHRAEHGVVPRPLTTSWATRMTDHQLLASRNPLTCFAGVRTRRFDEGMGELIGLASHQTLYLKELGLLSAQAKPDTMQVLLRDALESVTFLYFVRRG